MTTGRTEILLIEDEAPHAELIRRGLESRLDLNLTVVSTLGEARAHVAENQTDLAIADFLLPDGEGIDLLPSDSEESRFPVVIMTSHGDEQIAVDAMKSGALDYVVKNEITLANMGQVVDRALREWNHVVERRRAEKALQASEQRFRALYDDNPSMFFTVDSDGTILSVNQFGAERLDFTVQALLWKPFSSLYVEDQRDFVDRNIAAAFDNPGEIHRWEACKLRSDRTPVWVRVVSRVTKDPKGAATMLVVCEDITEVHNLSEELSYQTTHDALTRLLNRREFERRLVHVLRLARTERTEHALCYLDLDQFKVINDTCGHKAGDELLRQIGQVLQEHVRSRDTLARLGGDEFAILMEHCSVDDAQRVASLLRESIQEYRFLWEDQSFAIGVSIAVVPINESSRGLSEVMAAADAACYTAKDEGRNRIHVYRADDVMIARRHGEMQWVARIHKAMEEHRFRLYCQPIVPLATKRNHLPFAHGEILIRMIDENDGVIEASSFLSSAERYHLVERIDRWVIQAAFSWLADHRDVLDHSHLWTINLSGQSIGNQTTLDFVIEQLDEHAIPADKICFEVTETVAIANISRAMTLFRALRELGIRFALDDFGTGISSFGYLKTLPVDFVKIDGIFIRDILRDPVDAIAVRSINEIAHAMGKQTIAEFVQDEATFEKVRELSIDYAQGYGLGRPIPIDDFPGGFPIAAEA